MSRMIKFLRQRRNLIVVIGGLLIIDLIPDLLSNAITEALGSTVRYLVMVAGALGLVAVVWVIIDRRFLLRKQVLVPEDARPQPMKGLVMLVGTGREKGKPEDTAAVPTIEYHIGPDKDHPVLQTCWLIATAGPTGSIDYALQLQKQYRQQGLDVRVREIKSAFDLRESYEAVQAIYEGDLPERWTEQEVIADITGGTKLMTAGMILACAPNDRPMEFMTGGREKMATVPMLLTFQPAEADWRRQ